MLIGVAVLIMIAAGTGVYLSTSSQYTNPQTSSGSSGTGNLEATVGTVREITVNGMEYGFSPPLITVKRGETVRIIFKNVGTTGHNFVIPGLGISTPITIPGTSAAVTFKSDEAGTFPIEFMCTVPGHRERGMFGQIIVQ